MIANDRTNVKRSSTFDRTFYKTLTYHPPYGDAMGFSDPEKLRDPRACTLQRFSSIRRY
jgi:hypothetical protein